MTEPAERHQRIPARQVRLLKVDEPDDTAPNSQRKHALLFIAEPDVAGIVEPLTRALRDRRTPITVEALGNVSGWLDQIAQRRPTAVVINVDTATSAGDNFVRTLRLQPQMTGIAVVALGERMEPQRISWLRSVGYDAFLETPFHLMTLEPFLLA